MAYQPRVTYNDRFFNGLVKLTKKATKFCISDPLVEQSNGNPRIPFKRPIMRNMFRCRDLIMEC